MREDRNGLVSRKAFRIEDQMPALRPRRLPILLASVLITALLAACGGASSGGGSSTTGGGGGSSYSVTPATGDLATLTWDLTQGEPTSMDPVTIATPDQLILLPNFCDSLYWRDPSTGKLIPDLAISSTQPNSTTFVYNIRHGVRFWDGHLLTAKDVVYSLERVQNPKISVNYQFFSAIDSVTATGPYQVTIHLTKPDTEVPQELSGPTSAVVEEAFVKRLGSKFGTAAGGIMCSGPFKFVRWVPGSEIVGVRNTAYWTKSLIPKAKTVVFKVVSDTSALSSGLLTNSFDGAWHVPAASYPELSTAPNGHLYNVPGLEALFIVPFSGQLANPAIRRALDLVIDRKGLAQSVLHGTAQALTGFLPPAVFTSNSNRTLVQAAAAKLPGGTPDLSAARAQVKAAGSPKAPIVIGLLGTDESQVAAGTAVQAAAAEVGLNVQIRALAPTQYDSLYVSPASRQGLAGALLGDVYLAPVATEEFEFFALPKAFSNYIGYSNPTVTADFNKARETFNSAQQTQLMLAAQAQFIGKDAGMIPIVSYNWLSFVRHGIGGFNPSPYIINYPWAARIGSSK